MFYLRNKVRTSLQGIALTYSILLLLPSCSLNPPSEIVTAIPSPLADIKPDVKKEPSKLIHSDRGGFFVRLGGDKQLPSDAFSGYDTVYDLLKTHPVLDGVIVPHTWNTIQPTDKNSFDFSQIKTEIRNWTSLNKKVIVGVALYGKGQGDQAQTPPWVYNEPGVRKITYCDTYDTAGNCVAWVSHPAVWEGNFVETLITPLIKRLAEELDNEPGITYFLPGIGFIGNLNSLSDPKGVAEFLASPDPINQCAHSCPNATSWTVEQWMDYARKVVSTYQKNFKTPLFIKAAQSLLRDPTHNNYEAEAASLLNEFGLGGIAVTPFGLSHDTTSMAEILGSISSLVPMADQGLTRIGVGDDWPIFEPEDSIKPDKNEANFRIALQNSFGGVAGIPLTPTTMFFLQQTDYLYSHPSFDSKRIKPDKAPYDYYRKSLCESLAWAKFGHEPEFPRSFLSIDRLIFGGFNMVAEGFTCPAQKY